MTKTAIIADSGPLIALAVIDQLELLHKLYSTVIAPPAVWHEVTIKGQDMPGAQAVSQLKWLTIRKPESQVLKPFSILVDPGEAEAIALAQTVANSIVLLDDAQARRVAEYFNIPRIGTLGILRRAKKAGFLNQIKPYIENLQANNIYMAKPLVEAVLQDVGEF